MQVLNKCAALLSNFEVLEILKEQAEIHSTPEESANLPANVKTIEYEVASFST